MLAQVAPTLTLLQHIGLHESREDHVAHTCINIVCSNSPGRLKPKSRCDAERCATSSQMLKQKNFKLMGPASCSSA